MLNKVLCVDDDPVTLLLQKVVLSKTAFAREVVTACNGAECINLLETAAHCSIDLIFLDINMPEKNGWDVLNDLAHWAPEKRAGIRVVVLSSSVNPEDEETAKRYDNVIGFISKPLTPEKLASLKKGCL